MWRTQRSQHYLVFWAIGFFVGALGWLINLIPIESFPSERLFWLVDISITIISVSAVTYGFLLRSFQSFNAIWLFIAGFIALHWIAYFSSIQIDYGLKMAISPLYVAVCMQLIVGIMWLKNKRFSSLEWAVGLVCQVSVIVHVTRAYLYSMQAVDTEQLLLSAYNIVSYLVLPAVYTATGAALIGLVVNDKETSNAPLIDLKSGTLNSQGLQQIAAPIMWNCEKSKQWVSVIACRVNHLRSIEQQYGNDITEHILHVFTKSLSDEVANRGYIGIQDNKEFVILLPMLDGVKAAAWAAKLRLIVSQLNITCRRERVPVTVGVGIASSCDDYDYDKQRTLALEAIRSTD
jgi:diguanylate cyclase (GGDEF)-like protein